VYFLSLVHAAAPLIINPNSFDVASKPSHVQSSVVHPIVSICRSSYFPLALGIQKVTRDHQVTSVLVHNNTPGVTPAILVKKRSSSPAVQAISHVASF